MKGPISPGDLLRALAALQPGDEVTAAAIRDMLGFLLPPASPAMPSTGAWMPTTSRSPAAPARPTRPAGPASPAAGPSSASRSWVVRRIESEAAGATAARPSWLDDGGDRLGPARLGSDAPPPPPLFGPPRGRAILVAAIATDAEEGDVDVGRVIDMVGSREPIERLPRERVPTLRRGVQLLLDVATAMNPFRQDQQTLRDSLDDVLSDDRLEVLSFAACPGRGAGAGGRETWRAWEPPPPGTPVVAVTDLGIGATMFAEDRPTVAEWLRFARRVHSAGHALVALVPYEALRWPAVLAREITIMHWSERTSVGEVRRALRNAGARLR